MKFFVLLVLCAGIVNAYAQNSDTAAIQPYRFVEIDHGLSTPYNPNDSSSSHTFKFKVIRTTDSIPEKLYSVFGVSYQIVGFKNADLRATVEWIYPKPIRETDGYLYGSQRTNLSLAANTETSCFFITSRVAEMVKGKWVLNYYLEGELVFSRNFIIY